MLTIVLFYQLFYEFMHVDQDRQIY